MKKKRGRPRKYGSIVALSPMPISASIPLSGDYSTWKQSGVRKVNSFKKKNKLEFRSPGETMAYSVGGGFTPHVITVSAGEDVTMKIISFSQQGSRAICILAANGTVSNVTLRQSNSSGGTMTYEGHFEIVSLMGSFMPNDNGLTKSRTGGMSVSLAGPDGRVLGGGLAGMLVAAGSVQVVIGSFLPVHQLEQKPKKTKLEHTIAFVPSSTNPISQERYEVSFNGPNPNLKAPAPFIRNNMSSINSIHGSKITDIDNNDSLIGEDSGEQSHEITC
ncbi:AT-hook motif nuclear-localized protein 1-like isoform X2 [Henckelia pumila]